MGSMSNRPLSKSEEIGKFVEEIIKNRNQTESFDWQTSTGAKIRGKMGVEKGNELIRTIKNLIK